MNSYVHSTRAVTVPSPADYVRVGDTGTGRPPVFLLSGAKCGHMAPGPYERVLETLEDLDAHLAGLEVGYSEANASAAQDRVADLTEFFENEPEDLTALRDAVEELVDTENSAHAQTAKEHADSLKRQVEDQIDEE